MNIFLDFFLHIDKNLVFVINHFGIFSYFVLFLVIFMETGFVVTPFLPGDSLLFAAGALATKGALNIYLLNFILILAALLGDTVNYWIGHFIGPKAFNPKSKIKFLFISFTMQNIFKQEYLKKAEIFYEKHGGKAIVLARFVPIVRTFAPFFAGVSKMDYKKFISFNIFGGIIWVSIFLLSGYFFGAIPFIQNNFHYVVIIIIIISLIPILFEIYNSKNKKH